MSQAQAQEFEFDFNIDDLPDLPEFALWPVGVYQVEGVSLSCVRIGTDESPALELKVKLEAIQDYKPANATLPEIGSTNSWSFFLDGKDERKTILAQGSIKKILAPFTTLTNGNNSTAAIAAVVPGAKFTIVTSLRSGKLTNEQKAAGEEAKIYSGIKNLYLS